MTGQGKKINLTFLKPDNGIFSAIINATESFSNEITAYTVLYGPNNKVLSIKLEKIENGLMQNASYITILNYPSKNIYEWQLLVFDVEQNPSVFGKLQIKRPQ